MLEDLTLPEICELIAEHKLAEVSEILDTWLPADLASIIHALEPDNRVTMLTTLGAPVAASTFSYLNLADQEALVSTLPKPAVAMLLNGMPADDRTALLSYASPEQRHLLMSLLTPEHFAVAQRLLSYGDNTVGRLMSPDMIAIRREWTVQHVLDYIRAHGRDRETLNVIYVVDEHNHLIDDIRIRELLVAPLDQPVAELTDEQFVTLSASDLKQTAVEVFRKYDRTALPVVDYEGKLLGVVTIDDVLDIAEQRATQALQRFGGLEALEEPYVATPLLAMVRKRASWLVILFVGEMLTATAMSFFEDEIAQAVVLALFVPLIISSGGNSGSQAATLIVRALALGEVRLRDWWMVMRREFISGLLLGAILGAIGMARIGLWSAFSDAYGPHWPLIALTVGLSLVGIVLWGSLSGSMLPFLLKRLGLDPATSSAPFVATLVDVTGLVIYFSVAFVILRGTLL
ncbi:MAG: magnesium transporter [Planctomycetes bacterium]|nr:magnesium transporter [Planctomycetota bacterium]